jgi:cobalt-zinc-cadmium efflux system outer membrane protein
VKLLFQRPFIGIFASRIAPPHKLLRMKDTTERRMAAAVMALAGLVAFAGFALAEDTKTLSLAEAVAAARERNPTLAIAREQVAVAKGNRVQAGLIRNPSLTATSENQPYSGSPGFSFANHTDDYIYAGQQIELGGKRGRRIDVAQAGMEAAALEAEIASRRLAASVALAYWMASGTARVRDLYRDEAEMLQRMVAYNRARVHEGATAEADLLRIQIEADRMAASANLAAAEANRAVVELYRQMAASEFPKAVKFSDPLEKMERVETPEIDTVLRERPEMQLARARLKRAEASVALERANAIPDPELMFGYKRWSGYSQFTGLNTMFFGVKTPVPIFNRNQGKIEAAQATLRSAQLDVEAQALVIRAEVASARGDYLRAREALERIMPLMSDRAGRNLDITREAYRIGGTDLIRYLDAERTRVETEVLYARALGQYHQSAVNLAYATGILR